MDVAVLGESSADEAGVFAFAQSLLAGSLSRVPCPVQIRRGWPAIRSDLKPALLSIYHQTTAQAVLIVVDADGAPLDDSHPNDRLSQLNEIVRQTLQNRRPGRPPLRVAVGLAVPSIEAWWLSPQDSQISEAAWKARHRPGGAVYTKLSLKSDLYGTEDPQLAHETSRLCEGATAVASASDVLKLRFPYGFGPMINQIRSWADPSL